MLRLPGRAWGSPKPLLSTLLRHHARPQSFVNPVRTLASTSTGKEQTTRSQHAVSGQALSNIEKRWDEMDPQQQAELWMALRDRMTVNWHDLTMQEKRASYWIAFGPWGPRAQPDPNEKWEIAKLVIKCLIASGVLFALTRHFAGPAPRTMTQEWQELSNEYLRAQKSDPISGVSSEGYEGKGMVQSKKSGITPGEEEEDEE